MPKRKATKKRPQAAAPTPPAAQHTGGRPEHVPDSKSRSRVTVWAGGGIDQVMIAKALGISRPTLVKHYKPELAIGAATMDGLAISALASAMQRGGKEAVAAAKWWTQSRMGWTERVLIDDEKLRDTPVRVIVELVGDAAADIQIQQPSARTRPGFDPSKAVTLVG